jgi:Arc/MetJ-type ribon-helix-helix transcriptional regulator
MQAKFSFDEEQASFLNNYRDYGYKDKSSMVREALQRMKKELELKQLERSADLYAELYASDSDLQEWTESAVSGWPE